MGDGLGDVASAVGEGGTGAATSCSDFLPQQRVRTATHPAKTVAETVMEGPAWTEFDFRALGSGT